MLYILVQQEGDMLYRKPNYNGDMPKGVLEAVR